MRGAKPKVYPASLVEKVRALYDAGHTQCEVAQMVGVSQKVVWNLMSRHGIPRRPQVKRNQRGENNTSWKGGAAKYAALHLRVATARGTPSKCEQCGTTDPGKRYEWASMTKNYADIMDYKRMCASCHKRHDGIIKNIRWMRCA